MAFDIDQVLKEKKPGDIAALLPEFRECQTYQARLDFWDRHNLHLQVIHVATGETDPFERAGSYAMAVDCDSWESQKLMDVLSIEPFTKDEISIFFGWGLEIRRKIQDRIEPFYNDKFLQDIEDKKTANIILTRTVPALFLEDQYLCIAGSRNLAAIEWGIQEISSIGFSLERRISEFSKRYNNAIEKDLFARMQFSQLDTWDFIKISESETDSITTITDFEQWFGINIGVYNQALMDFKYGDTEGLHSIYYSAAEGKKLTNWNIIDTYIRAESDCRYRQWLSEKKREYEHDGKISIGNIPEKERDRDKSEGHESDIKNNISSIEKKSTQRKSTQIKYKQINDMFTLFTKVEGLGTVAAQKKIFSETGDSISTIERAIGHKK